MLVSKQKGNSYLPYTVTSVNFNNLNNHSCSVIKIHVQVIQQNIYKFPNIHVQYVLKFDLTYDSTGTSLFGDTFFIFFIFVWQALVKFK